MVFLINLVYAILGGCQVAGLIENHCLHNLTLNLDSTNLDYSLFIISYLGLLLGEDNTSIQPFFVWTFCEIM